jgi:catechol 2,3-dioxygenase-like lactoylglutathione lyase family enzyme
VWYSCILPIVTADRGLTHVALPVSDVDSSAEFYARYADMEVVHRRVDQGVPVVWLSDLTRPFVVVLLQTDVTHTLGGWSHLGVACTSREVVDERCRIAADHGINVSGPFDSGPPVGYWAIISDPDGHHLELSHGQAVNDEIDSAIERSGGNGR